MGILCEDVIQQSPTNVSELDNVNRNLLQKSCNNLQKTWLIYILSWKWEGIMHLITISGTNCWRRGVIFSSNVDTEKLPVCQLIIPYLCSHSQPWLNRVGHTHRQTKIWRQEGDMLQRRKVSVGQGGFWEREMGVKMTKTHYVCVFMEPWNN